MFDRDVSLFGRKRPIPEYYDTMYMDGYEPWEIMEAVHKRMLRMAKEREAEHDRKKERDRKSSKKKKSNLEAEVFAIMEKSLKTALDVALDDIFKDWK